VLRLVRFHPWQYVVLGTLVVILVLTGVSGGSMFSPGPLSRRGQGDARLGGVASHAELSRNCSACHVPPWGRETMADRCLACHDDVGRQIARRGALADYSRFDHGRLDDATQCRRCHTEHNGPHAALTDLSRFDHAALTDRTCSACHAEPHSHKGRMGTDCARCHSTTSWGDVTVAGFDHDRAAFKLTGKHKAVDCKACHVDQVFKGTPQTCAGCHAEPKVHKGNFGTACAQCHSTETWKGAEVAGFDHSKTAFKLTGKHQTTDCKSCHVNQVYKGTPTSCVSCHAEPQAHKGSFGTACAQCHSTSTWKGAVATSFDHDRTAFKLTGKHQAVDCKACHANQVFKGAPQTCVGCHAEPQAHKGKFDTACAECHSTTTWKGATFKHVFPINHGSRDRNRGANACGTCHADAPNFQTYTCYGCHAHQPAAMARRHPRLTAVQLQVCAKCHRGGRGGGREGRAVGRDDGPTPEGAGCPVATARADGPCGRCADDAGVEDRFLVVERLAARRASRAAEHAATPPAPALAWQRGEPWPDGLGLPGVDLYAPGRRRPSQGLRARRRRFGLVGPEPGR
jgi:hypothetical protein